MALRQGGVREWIEELPPADADYAALSAAYRALAAQSRTPAPPRIPPGPPIRVGDTDVRRPQVIAALSRELAAAPSTFSPDPVWSQADADRLKRYQRSRGLREDGIVGPNTLALLNATPRDKARRLAVNLERLRWLERNPPATRIDVNTAASDLTYLVDGKLAWTTEVVPGRPGHATPQLQASFENLGRLVRSACHPVPLQPIVCGSPFARLMLDRPAAPEGESAPTTNISWNDLSRSAVLRL